MILPSLAARQALIQHLKQTSISAIFHYLPLQLSAMGEKIGGRAGDCPVSEKVSDCLVRPPFFDYPSEIEQAFVIEEIKKIRFFDAARD